MIRLHLSTSQLRIRLKRVFASYYLDVCSLGIATPSEVYEAMSEYFDARAQELGAKLLQSQLEEEVLWLAGEIEQDIRRRHAEIAVDCLERESLEGRFRECLTVAWRRS